MPIVPGSPDPAQRLGYLLPAFINLSLPNAAVEAHSWTRTNGNQTLTVTAGTGIGPDGSESFIPYGKMARAALMFLCTDAVVTSHPIIPVSQTYRGFLKQLGVTWNARNCANAIRQLQAVAASHITLTTTTEQDDATSTVDNERFTISFRDHMVFRGARDARLADPEESHIELSADFMRLVSEHGAVPIRADAWRHLLERSKTPLALDLYVWLSYRLYSIKMPVRISWAQLHQQFGSSGDVVRFKAKFRAALEQVKEVYPEANVKEFGDTSRGSTHGIMLSLSKNALDSRWASINSCPAA
ncbi:replication protein RepA [Kocuria marina]|uniref:replication protein RepA n=1 Tax=Kocuria marina TaxID=223184 RepID=UPI00119E6685|nr:replication protein RepA [Kocuria indica]